MAEAALKGVRVIDFGRFIAAPYCAAILADLGAEVIRVERPGGAEDRSVGRKAANGENFVYPGLGRNKKAVSLELAAGVEARVVLADLVRRADVFLHSLTPSVARAGRLGYEDVRALRPDIVYTGVTCFGPRGEEADRPGFDPIAQCISGAASLNGFDHEPPLRAAVPWVDYSTGLALAVGVLAALRHRERTGEGQEVTASLFGTAVSFVAPMAAEAFISGEKRLRLGNRAPYTGPSDLYRCRDGYVFVSAATDGMWRALATTIGHAELLDDPGLRTNEQRFQRRGEVDALVAQWMADRNVAEVERTMAEKRIPCGRCQEPDDLPHDQHVALNGMLEWVDLEAPGLERVPVTGTPMRLAATPGSVRSRAPRPGEHNREIYGDLLGYDEARMAALAAAGII